MKAAPARPLAEDGTAFERQLLASARADAIPAASLERLARALSVPSAARAPLSPARLARQGSLMKVGAWGLLGAVAATAALRWLDMEPVASEPMASERMASNAKPSEHSAAAMPGANPLASPPPVEAPAASLPASVERQAERPEAAASASPHRARARARSRRHRETQPSAAETDGLRAELVAVEAIQRALRAGRNSDAERRLADYARRFPRGELALEAELLSIDLDVAQGELERARSHARELLERAEATRYRARLEALTTHAD